MLANLLNFVLLFQFPNTTQLELESVEEKLVHLCATTPSCTHAFAEKILQFFKDNCEEMADKVRSGEPILGYRQLRRHLKAKTPDVYFNYSVREKCPEEGTEARVEVFSKEPTMREHPGMVREYEEGYVKVYTDVHM